MICDFIASLYPKVKMTLRPKTMFGKLSSFSFFMTPMYATLLRVTIT